MTHGPNLERLLKPSSIAVIGASPDGGGGRILSSLKSGGYTGTVFAVNPRREVVGGYICYPTVQSLPTPADLAFIATPAHTVLGVIDELHSAGTRAAIVYASGFSDAGEEGRTSQEQLAERTERYGIALCGPSSMGLINALDGVPCFIGSEGIPEAGAIGLISQSAGFIDAIRTSGSHVRLGVSISTGNEASLSAADYLLVLAADPRLRVIGLVLEAVRKVPLMATALDSCQRLGKTVVVLKIGASAAGRAAALSHTGSLVGDDEAWSAFFRRHSVIRAGDLDELVELLALLSSDVRPRGRRTAFFGTSGGKAGLYADLAQSAGLQMAEFAAPTVRGLRELLGSSYLGQNPVDGGLGGPNPDKSRRCLTLIGADPNVDVLCMYADFPVDPSKAPYYMEYCTASLRIAGEVAASQATPMVFINTRAVRNGETLLPLDQASRLPVLHGAREALTALRMLAELGENRWPIDDAGVVSTSDGRARVHWQPKDVWPLTFDSGLLSPEATAGLLSHFGIEQPPQRYVSTAQEAMSAAEELGYPVVVKLVSTLALHKADQGLVVLDLRSADAVMFEASRLLSLLPKDDEPFRILVQRMSDPGVEIVAGLKVDEDVGPIFVFGLGGAFVEVLRSVTYELLPLSHSAVERMIRESAAARLLDGVRGNPAADIGSLSRSLRGLADLGWACAGEIVEADVNPIIVRPRGQGAWAVDARFIVRT